MGDGVTKTSINLGTIVALELQNKQKIDTVDPLYTNIRYNDIIGYSNNLNGTIP